MSRQYKIDKKRRNSDQLRSDFRRMSNSMMQHHNYYMSKRAIRRISIQEESENLKSVSDPSSMSRNKCFDPAKYMECLKKGELK